MGEEAPLDFKICTIRNYKRKGAFALQWGCLMRDGYSCQEPVPKHGDMLEDDTIVPEAWLKAIDPETARLEGCPAHLLILEIRKLGLSKAKSHNYSVAVLR